MLKSIEITGFKSFAKKSVLEFSSPVTAVVGPNGSGKSNVAEAFRFALGEQSVKSMRGKKGEDLIWNGASSEPRANRAGVKVVFDNTKKIFPVDFSEVVLERVVNRDGSNEYLLNGSTVRLKDIFELLSSASLGSSGHHIISQGEADRVLNASTKERRAIIEDALGLKLYQYKRVESERKLAKTRENIVQVELLRKEIAPHLKFLKREMDKVARAEEIRKELADLAQSYFRDEEVALKAREEALRTEREPLDKELKRLAQHSEEAKKVSDMGEELNKIRAKRDELARELGRLEGAIQAEERVLREEERAVTSDEHKTVRLKEVEELFDKVQVLQDLAEVFSNIKTFISERKHKRDSDRLAKAEASLKELRDGKAGLEQELDKVRIEEHKIGEAEKTALLSESLERELAYKLSVVKTQEEALDKDKSAYKQELVEVGHLIGKEFLDSSGNSRPTQNLPSPELQSERRAQIQKLKIRLEDAGVSGAGDIAKEFKETSERDEFLSKELLDLETSASSIEKLITELEERLATEFKQGVEKINKGFGELFSEMFGGGEAKLVLTKESVSKHSVLEDALIPSVEETEIEEGLDISVSLPRKKVRSLMMLSGGERALTSIALIFAVSLVKPPPFVILDETDAALDESNSRKYGDMIERLAQKSQLILITHNRETMSRAGKIYGVTMGSNGVSKLLSIGFEDAVAVAK